VAHCIAGQYANKKGGNTTVYYHKPLPCNVTNYYRVGALDNTGRYLSFSDTIKLTPFDTIKPPPPLLYFANVQSDNSIKLAWHWDKKSDVKYFDIFRSKNGSAPVRIKTVIYDSVYTDVGVTPKNDTFSYYVIATDSCNVKNRSKPSRSDTIMNMNLYSFACTPQIEISWDAYKGLPHRPDSYEVYRSSGGGPFAKIISLPTLASHLKFMDNTVSLGTLYFYKIRAVDSKSSYSSYSDSMGLKPRIVPIPDSSQFVYATMLRTGATNGQIYLQWKRANIADTNIKGYHIYGYDDDVQKYVLIHNDKNVNDTSFVRSGVNTIDSAHHFYVAAYNSCDIEGPPSEKTKPINLRVLNGNLFEYVHWRKYWGDSVMGYSLHKSNDGGTPYIVKKLARLDSSYLDTNVYCGHTYTYMVSGQLRNGKTTNSDSFTVAAFDTTPPPPTRILVATVSATSKTTGQIQLSFRGNNDKNRSGYNIYRASSNGYFSLAYSLANTTHGLITWMDVLGLNTVDSTYRYYVAAMDSCNNQALPLDTHQVVHLKMKAYNQFIKLKWTSYKGWKNWKYQLLKKEGAGGWYVFNTVGKDTLSFIDSNVYCHQVYAYMILATDALGSYLSYSNESKDTGINTLPPVVKPIQRATVIKTSTTKGKVNVSWNRSPSKNIEFYNVYRSEDGKNWTEVSHLNPRLNLTDSGFNTYSQPYYYKIQPVDSCGNLGQFSIIHKTINLKARPGNSQNNLSWNKYEGWNVKQYLVIKNGTLLATLPNTALAYSDTLVLCGTVYNYVVKAVCDTTADTLFSASNTDSARAFDHVPPQRVYLKSVSVTNPNKSATITWLPSPSWDVKNYYIYRKSAINGSMKFIDSTDNTSYVDNSQEIIDPDCYYVFARDHCGNQSAGSNQGCIIVLNGKNYAGYNDITWNGYEKWPDGVGSYNVYKNEDGQGWTMIGIIPTGTIDNFLDKNLGDTTINFCYQVEAVETNGQYNATSRSTVECLHQDATVFVPNSFTHYLIDGLNDKFGPKGSYIKNYTMQVYNRWGEQLFNTAKGEQWDGTFRGTDVPEGVYIYYIIVEDYNHNFTRFKGNITIFK